MVLIALALLVGAVSLFGGLGRKQCLTVNVVGSTSVQPFAEMLSQEFDRVNKDCQVEVQGGGSTFGIEAIRNGIADIGMCSRALKQDEELNSVVIARDGLAVVVNHANSIPGLGRDQIRDIFSGKTRTWRAVGGPDQPIRIISREEGSGTREAFVKLIMGKERISRGALTQESNGAVRELVKNDPFAIGYMSLELVQNEARILPVDGIAPDHETVKRKHNPYPLVRPFLFVFKGELKGVAARFVQFVLSEPAQKMLEKEGLVSAGEMKEPEGKREKATSNAAAAPAAAAPGRSGGGP
jgi:phosphate transport system substrate-binding protein